MDDQSLIEIMPLRIPTGWCVTFNSFFDVDPLVENGVFVNASYFSEDLLLLERKIDGDAKWMPLVIDVGWYPEEDINGRFKIVLASANLKDWLHIFETKDRLEVRKTIEKWMLVLATTMNEQEVRDILGLNQ